MKELIDKLSKCFLNNGNARHIDYDSAEKILNEFNQNMSVHSRLKRLTVHVRETKGEAEALRFYVKYIQPVKKYFGGDEAVNKLIISGSCSDFVQSIADKIEYIDGSQYKYKYRNKALPVIEYNELVELAAKYDKK